MKKPHGIFISGTGGTGSTLMRRLFMSFRETQVIHKELMTDDFLFIMLKKHLSLTLVATRKSLAVFAHPLLDEEIERQLDLFDKHNVGVLVMTRDFEAASASMAGRLTHAQWVGAYSAVFKYWRSVDYLCNYYRLVAEPDVVQKEIAKVFSLEIVHKFSQYPDFCGDECGTEWEKNPQHKPRRIGADYDRSQPRR